MLYVGRVSKGKSLVYYGEDQTTHDLNQRLDFVPIFSPTFTSAAAEQAAQALCGGDVFCLLDYAVTGDSSMATATLHTTHAVDTTNHLLSKFAQLVK
jgi:tryptophan synthase alpha subunit